MDCPRKFVSSLFRKLGRTIGLHLYYFILFPLLITATFSVFIVNLKNIENIVELYVSDRGKIFDTKKFIEYNFPFNTSTFIDPVRYTTIPNIVLAMFTKKEGGNMLDKDVLKEINHANQFIKNITVKVKGREIGFSDICGSVHGKCFENPIIEVLDDILLKRKKLKYPVDIDPLTFSYRVWVTNFGGVIVDEYDSVETVNAMRLMYFTDESDKNKQDLIEKWKEEVYKRLKNYKFKYLRYFNDYIWSAENEFMILHQIQKPMIGALVVFVSIFCLISCISNNWVKSKPLLGVASVVSAGLAVVTSFGLMSVLGIETTIWNITVPFLVLVTEVDDAFVLIASWRISNPKNKVHKRIEETYYEAGVSIALTSLTNLFSYCIGMMSSFSLIRLFCYYSATCIIFTFLYQITFFGGCMALSGYNEEKHNQVSIRNFETIEDIPEEDRKFTDEPMMALFRDKLGRILSHNISKIIIIITYFLNLSFGLWGALTITQGLDFIKLFSEHSPITESTRMFYKNFGRYPYPCQVVINKTLDYSDRNVQKSIDELLNRFESLPHIAESRFTTSWLKYYKEFQNQPIAKYSLQGYNMSVKQDFIDGLRNVFLRFKAAEQFSNDIVFNQNGSDILYSRFHLLVNDTISPAAEIKMLIHLWKISEEFDFPILIHTIISAQIEEGIIIGRTISDLFWITSLLIMLLFLLLVPNIVSAIIVAVSVVSTMIETFGYMSLWGVNLDIFSMMSLILCVGFCVNYPAHMSYAYVCSLYETPKEKMNDSLYRIGYPICQGSLSTILGILFVYRDMYACIVFVKIVFLIAVETAFHALLFIPVMHYLISSHIQISFIHCNQKER